MSDDGIDMDNCLYVTSTRGAHLQEDDHHAYIVEFTARQIDHDDMAEEDEVVVIGLVAEAAADLIRHLVAIMTKYSPNALYDAGVIAARYRIGPQEDEA